MPTFEDIKIFIKDNFKFIAKVMVICIVFYGIGIAYTMYSDSKISETVDEEQTEVITTDEEIGNDVKSTEEILALKEKLVKDSVSFKFYLETNTSSAFSSVNLLNQIFTSPSIIQTIEEKSGISFEIKPEYAVNITFNKDNSISTLTVGTGNYKNNIAIADSYYSLLENKEIAFLDNKNTYMVSKPSRVVSNNFNIDDTEQNNMNPLEEETINRESNSTLSIKQLLMGSILVLIGSFFLGICLALIKDMRKKEISETLTFSYTDTDKFINLRKLKNLSIEEKNKSIVNLIAHPPKPIKILLDEEELDMSTINELTNQFKIIAHKSIISPKGNEKYLVIAKDINEVNPNNNVDEIIILVRKDKTKKEWYQNQRILMKNYAANVKICLI